MMTWEEIPPMENDKTYFHPLISWYTSLMKTICHSWKSSLTAANNSIPTLKSMINIEIVPHILGPLKYKKPSEP